MSRPESPDHSLKEPTPTSSGSPAGAPNWITPELIRRTIETWQPHMEQVLTEEDALRILLDVGHLLDLLDGPDE